ncbi:MAG: sigma-70 family RNA polymerase sigma factor [Christensenellaceae bacterium]|nr:sigma-70 family RNA polymerase sigma factor [Christensenellaceae bacterium]
MSNLQDKEELNIALKEYALTKDVDLRNRILEHFLYMAAIVAKKFIGRGVDYEDLHQVASLALVKAIERFDPDRGIQFASFAAPSMIGEVKNYFRDKTRMLRISRRDSEQLLMLSEAKARAEQEHGIARPRDIAEYMGVSEERVLELLEIQRSATSVGSLDMKVGEGEDTSIAEMIGGEDADFGRVENNDFLKKALSSLSEQEKTIVVLRFWKERSQKQVADQLGVSQMYVSRAEKKIMEKLRRYSEK